MPNSICGRPTPGMGRPAKTVSPVVCGEVTTDPAGACSRAGNRGATPRAPQRVNFVRVIEPLLDLVRMKKHAPSGRETPSVSGGAAPLARPEVERLAHGVRALALAFEIGPRQHLAEQAHRDELHADHLQH